MNQNRKKIVGFLLLSLICIYLITALFFLYVKNKKSQIELESNNTTISSTVFPLVENDINVVSFDCKINKLISDEISLGDGFIAMLSAECAYLDLTGEEQIIQVPLALKGPDNEAIIDGVLYENYSWDEMDSKSLINTFRINYWQENQSLYDLPESWINGGSGKGVDFGEKDILRVRLASNYSSAIFTNPGYSRIANFGRNQRQNIYKEDLMLKFIKTGKISILEESNKTANLPNNYLWSDNMIKGIFVIDN